MTKVEMKAALNDKLIMRIQELAYQEEGRPEGRALEHWLTAEYEILEVERPLRHI